MFAVKASDGSIRTAFNTCGACNPDINSYFIQNGEYFECQTCGNKFHIDEIGLERSFGCAPISILEDEKDSIGKDLIISKKMIEEYQKKFQSINIYENN